MAGQGFRADGSLDGGGSARTRRMTRALDEANRRRAERLGARPGRTQDIAAKFAAGADGYDRPDTAANVPLNEAARPSEVDSRIAGTLKRFGPGRTIHHPALAKVATYCEPFDAAVRGVVESDRQSRSAGERSQRGGGPPGGGLWPVDLIASLDVDPEPVRDYAKRLQKSIPDLAESIENAQQATGEFLANNDGETNNQTVEHAARELQDLRDELADTRDLVRSLRRIADRLDELLSDVADDFCEVAAKVDPAVHLIEKLEEETPEYRDAASAVHRAAGKLTEAGAEAENRLRSMESEIESLLDTAPGRTEMTDTGIEAGVK